ncbi:MAG: hypothetical protein EOO88_53220, partial [Pedobacter sp.]
MKIKLTYLILLVATICFNACKKDKESPTKIPVVKTGVATAVGLTAVTATGSIISDGNSPVVATGFVYSSNVALPTTADNKKELTDTDGDFNALIEGLSSGTTYHIRAYATNGIGTGYGEVIDYTTGNAGPVATNVTIEGTPEVSKTLTANYTYNDAEQNPEGATQFQWFVATSTSGTGEVAIVGATAKAFVIKEAQSGKFLRVSVTPKATAGTTDGSEVKSGYTGAVGSETVTFTYDNKTVTYGTIISTVTGKKWMDRNLGSTRPANSKSDYLAYGDYFQWGRLADGHQKVTRTGGGDADATGVTGMTSVSAPYETSGTDVPTTVKFIIEGSLLQDWRNPQAVVPTSSNLWQGVNGKNNPCPAGWRLPTAQEWVNETISNIETGFDKLRLTYTGARLGS